MLNSSMRESRLITGKWCKQLTSARETTNNTNGSQGIFQYNPRSVKNELKSNTHGIIQSTTNDVSRPSGTKNLSLRHASSKVPKGISRSILDNELLSTRDNLLQEGHNISFINDTRQWTSGRWWNRGGGKAINRKRIILLNMLATWLWRVETFRYQRIRGLMETTWIRWNEAKWQPKRGRENDDVWISQPDMKQKCQCSRVTSYHRQSTINLLSYPT